MVRTMKIARTTVNQVELAGPQRRQFTPAFKAALVQRSETESVASVALDHAINPVTVHRWIRESRERERSARPAQPAFVALQLSSPSTAAAAPAPALTGDIRIEFQGSGIAASVASPLDSAQACATWLRAVLQPAKP
jgi:transposase-like protein